MYLLYLTTVCPPSPPAIRLLVKVRITLPFNALSITEIAADSLRGRVFEVSLADLNRDSNEQAWRKMKVQVEEVKGYDCFTNFYGMSVTKDKLCTLVKKWHTLIEAFVQTKTLDGYLIRTFCIGFTKRTSKQVRATCYAQNSQKKLIRNKMMEIMMNEIQKSTYRELVKKLYVLPLILIISLALLRLLASRSKRNALKSSLSRTSSLESSSS